MAQFEIEKCHLVSDRARFATRVERVDGAGIGGRSILPLLRCRGRCWGFNVQARLVERGASTSASESWLGVILAGREICEQEQ